jgi:effector-binding domain-containing protein
MLAWQVGSAFAQDDKAGGLVGQEARLAIQMIVYLDDVAPGGNAFDAILNGLTKIYSFLEKEAVPPTGPAMTIYTPNEVRLAVPVGKTPRGLPQGLSVGKSPEGKALKFVHRGSYDSLEETIEALTDQFEQKGLEAPNVLVEVYLTDPRTTRPDKLVIEIYVLIE